MDSDFLDAAKDGNFEQTRRYIRSGCSVNYRSPTDGTTALYWAACAGHMRICKLLLDNGADVNTICNQWGSRPLHAAADRGHIECVYMLISGGAEVNLTCMERQDTPLHKAAYRGHYNTCQLLLDRGADTTMVNNEGKTPIQEAQTSRYYDVYQLILHYDKGHHRLKKPATELISSEPRRNKIPINLSDPLHLVSQSGPSSGQSQGINGVAKERDSACNLLKSSDNAGHGEMMPLKWSDNFHEGSQSTITERYYELSRKYNKLEAYADKLVLLLEGLQLKFSVVESKNKQLETELERLAYVDGELRATKNQLETLSQHRTRQLSERYPILATVQDSERAQNAEPMSSYRCRCVEDKMAGCLPYDTRRDIDNPIYSTVRQIFEAGNPDLVDAFSSTLMRQVKAMRGIETPLLVDVPWRMWHFGVDYVIETKASVTRVLLERGDALSQCTLVIRHKDLQYEMKVCALSTNSVDLKSRCFGFTELPQDANVHLPVHVFDLDMDDGLPSYMTQMFESQSIQCLVYQMTTTRLCDLLDLDTRGTVVPVLPEAFILLILYGIMSGLSYLHGQRVIHNPVTCRSIYLNRDLMPILKCIDPECTPDGVIRAFFNSSRQECLPLPPEVENISNTWSLLPEKDKESCVIRISEKADIFLLGYTVINIVSRCYRKPAPNPERLYDNSGTLTYPRIIANLSPGLSSLVWDMIRSKPEDRITAETCKIRVGLLMFGPKTDEIQTMRSYQVWHQAALMRILLDREEREISEIKSSSEYSRTVKSSLRHNEAILRRDFLTSLPLTKQWDIYRVNNSVNEMET